MFTVEEATIHDIQTAMEKKRLSSVELVKIYLQRIIEIDKEGPKLNSILEINPDALFIAEKMDRERFSQGVRGPLHGIPVILKDNINTGDKMHTSAGSLALADAYAPDDAFLVKKLREAGAIILGKANMTEFANFMGEKMPSGYSSRGGQVINPYDPGESPSGSSSGSAVAVAANLCAAAVGTETNGSILSPARVNRVVGIKPTVGLVSREGILPISNSQDTAGPIARTVTDAAILLGAMSGPDEKDPATGSCKGRICEDYTAYLDSTDVNGLRVGVSTVFYDKFTPEEQNLQDEMVSVLQDQGIHVIRQDKISKGLPEAGSSVLLHEFKVGINYYLSRLGHKTIHTLADIIAFNNAHPETALKYGQKVLELSEQTSGTLTEPKYIRDRLRDMEHTGTKGIDVVMEEYKLDALVFLESTSLAAVSGYPSVIVPAGVRQGTPYGVTFIGKAFSEPLLIKLAHVYESATKRRIPPKF